MLAACRERLGTARRQPEPRTKEAKAATVAAAAAEAQVSVDVWQWLSSSSSSSTERPSGAAALLKAHTESQRASNRQQSAGQNRLTEEKKWPEAEQMNERTNELVLCECACPHCVCARLCVCLSVCHPTAAAVLLL